MGAELRMTAVNDGLVLAALKALSNETKALVVSNELMARRMPSFQLRAVFSAMVNNEDERRHIVDLVDKDLQASGVTEEQVSALLNDLLSAPGPVPINEGVGSTRRLRSPFSQGFESPAPPVPPVQIGTGLDVPPPSHSFNRPAYGTPGGPVPPPPAPMTGTQFINRGQPGMPPPPPSLEEPSYPGSQRAPAQPMTPAALVSRATNAAVPPPSTRTATQYIPRQGQTNAAIPPPLSASQRYQQNHFSEADSAIVARPERPAGFSKAAYLPPDASGAGMPMSPSQRMTGITLGPGGLPLGNAMQNPAAQSGNSMRSPTPPGMAAVPNGQSSAAERAISEASLLTPGLANVNSPLTSRAVGRSDAPANFQPGAAMNSRRTTDGRPTILIADDDKRIRMVFRLRMEESGLSVIECADGTEAWERIQQGDISLAVLDMKMPGLHGLEVLSRMADKQYRIPVIVCSAYDQLKDEFVVQTYPKLRYLVKPVAPEQLVGSIKDLLQMKQAS